MTFGRVPYYCNNIKFLQTSGKKSNIVTLKVDDRNKKGKIHVCPDNLFFTAQCTNSYTSD